MVENHTPEEDRMSRCKVKHCSSSQNPRGALICHFKEKHCSPADVNDIEKALDFQVMNVLYPISILQENTQSLMPC